MNYQPLPRAAWIMVLVAAGMSFPVLADIAPTILPETAPSARTVELQEMWRVGGEDDEDILLGLVGRARMDAQGNTYLLDRQLSQVLVISPDGELLNTLGREGEGPGEMTRPNDLFLLEEGQVGVAQGFPGKIILINQDGTPGGTISIGESSESGGFFFLGEALMRSGQLVVHSGRGTFDMESGKNTTTQTLSRRNLQGEELARYVEHTRERDFTRQEFNEEKDFSELDTWALGDDVLYTAPLREEYLIHVRDLEGKVKVALSRTFSPRERSDQDKDDLTSNMRIIVNGVQQEIEKHVLDTDPAVMDLDVSADGRLFVENCYQQRKLLPEGVAGRFDVMAPDGKFVEELSLAIPGVNNKQDRLVFLDGKHWLLIRNFDSASDAMRAGFGDGVEEPAPILDDVEPLECVLYVDTGAN